MKNIIGLGIVLMLLGACNGEETLECAGSELVGTHYNDAGEENAVGATKVKGTKACSMTLTMVGMDCEMKGTFSDLNKGELEGDFDLTLTSQIGADCTWTETLPHTYELQYIFDGDVIDFGDR